MVSVHDLTTFEPRMSLTGKKAGVNIFAVDDTGMRLAIAVKKKIFILNWNGRQFVDYPRVLLLSVKLVFMFIRKKNFRFPTQCVLWCGADSHCVWD